VKGVSTLETPMQRIVLEKIEQMGTVLDIGGGGEGLVSRLEGQRVCAVDIRLPKIHEARIYGSDSQWILADARNLCFQDSCFDIATFWFSLGYLNELSSKKKALQEVHSCLRRGGHLSILAAVITCPENRLVFRTQFAFPDGTVSQISYGVKGNQNQHIEQITRLVQDAGFQVTNAETHEFWFRIDCLKP
jgi:ubiquinone/menaquinone biosynthesis C-methylase UbiE